MTPKLIDAHTHVQFAAFQNDWEVVVRRALDAGIWLVNVGTQKDTSARAVEIANKYPEGVYATVGLHPIHTDKSFHDEQELGIMNNESGIFQSRGEEFDYEYYKKLAQDPKVVAVGECGLDYYRISNKESGIREKQKAAFIKQIELAHDIKKPLMIHCRAHPKPGAKEGRDAYDDLIETLLTTHYSLLITNPAGIVHFFSGTADHAQKLLDLGFYFSFGGVITFTRDYDELIKYIPLDRILLETDAPYVAPAPYRGQRNEPLYVVEVAKKIGEIKRVSLDKISRQTIQNTKNIFGFGV